MNSKQTAESDFAHLNAMLDNLSQLLSDEYGAIKTGDIENLEVLLEQKNELLKNIEGISKRVEPSLGVLQNGDKKESEAALPEYIRDTLAKLVSCQTQNHINGSSIEANRRFSDSLLSVLTGSDPKQKTYASNGVASRSEELSSIKAKV